MKKSNVETQIKAFSCIALRIAIIIVTLALAACGGTGDEGNGQFTIGLVTSVFLFQPIRPDGGY